MIQFQHAETWKSKWLLIFKLWLVYVFGFSAAIFILYYPVIEPNLQVYKKEYASYFYPGNLYDFLAYNAWMAAILEEAEARGPAWLLVASGFTWTIKGYRADKALAWLLLIAGTAWWSWDGHLALNWSIFIAGLGWGWLVVKTRSLWPAMVSHGLANLTIFVAIRILSIFTKP